MSRVSPQQTGLLSVSSKIIPMKKHLFFLLTLFVAFNIQAQIVPDSTVYGLNFSASNLRFSKADISTGDLTIINNTPTSQDQFGSGVSDLDPITGRYFYIRAGKVYTVDGNTGTVLSSPTVTCPTDPIMSIMPITNIAYNWLDSTLYGLHHFGSQLKFAKVDINTGVMTIISPNNITGDQYASGVSDIDPFTNRYFYVRANRIVTVDITTGLLINNVQLTNPNDAVQPITNIAYNHITNQIYGLNHVGWTPSSPAQLRLASVDPITGEVMLISQSPISTDQFSSGVSDINPLANFYAYVRGISTESQIISVDLSTGEVISSPTLENSNNAVQPITNIAFRKQLNSPLPIAQFHNTNDGLTVSFRNISRYARNFSWDFGDGATHTDMHPEHTYATPGTYDVTLIVENLKGVDTLSQQVTVQDVINSQVDELEKIPLVIYPNPASQVLFLQAEVGQVYILDVNGKQLLQREIPPTGQLSLDLADWPRGFYFVRWENATDSQVVRLVLE
jgi:PKD repeat protein